MNKMMLEDENQLENMILISYESSFRLNIFAHCCFLKDSAPFSSSSLVIKQIKKGCKSYVNDFDKIITGWPKLF